MMVAFAAAALTLVVTDVQQRPLAWPILERAVDTAIAESGLMLRWEAAPPGQGRAMHVGDMRVILMDCHPRSGSTLILGSVLRERASDALWVYVGDVYQMLDGAALGSVDRWQLSIAVGRVIAHELAHLLAPAQPHSSSGLMSRTVDRRVLLQMDAPLDAAARSAIRAAALGLGPSRVRTSGAPSTFTLGVDFGGGSSK